MQGRCGEGVEGGALTKGSVLSEDKGFANLASNRSIPMTDEAMSPLRRRMIEDMTIRRSLPNLQIALTDAGGLHPSAETRLIG